MVHVFVEGKYGGPRLRDGLIVTFFKVCPFGEWASAVEGVFEFWRQEMPPEAVGHALVGASASTSKPADARAVRRCLGQVDPVKAAKREISAFEVLGPQHVNPDFLFSMLGVREPDEGETNYVEMRFPAEWADDNGERVARFALGVARILPHDSGYVSPALNWSNDAEIDDSAEDVHRLVFRHLGFDVHDHSQTYLYMGKRCLGARWMVFLGPALAEEVGGLETLSRALEGISVTATANGVALRCSGPPVPGDVNRDDDFSQLRAMAKVLEPITYFDDEIGFFDDDEEYMRWQRRFLD